MGKDIDHTVQGMDLLQDGFAAKYAAAKAAKPNARSIRVGRIKLKGTDPKIDRAIDDALARTGFQIVELDNGVSEKFEQAKKDGTTVAAAGAWISDGRFEFAPGRGSSNQVCNSGRPDKLYYGLPQRIGQTECVAGHAAQMFSKRWTSSLCQPFKKHRRELPLFNLRIGIIEGHLLQVQNTVPVNFAGNPALAIPVPLRGAKIPLTSLQLIGPRLAEAELLNAGRLVEEAVKTR